MADVVYTPGLAAVQRQECDFINDDFKMRLVEASYTPDPDDASLTPVGTGVGTDQPVAATKTIELDTVNNFVFWKCTTPPEWTTLATGNTIAGVVLYKFDTDDAGSLPIAYYAVTPTPTNGGSFEFEWNSDANGGVLKIRGA